jgi:hypothetical protein
MPPRYAYWTILIGDEPTAFRAGSQEDLMPTFKRLHEKHPSAKMMWFQNGKLWNSRLDAQEAMRARGEIGRRRDRRQDRNPANAGERFPVRRGFGGGGSAAGGDRRERPEWKPKGTGKLEWKPKGTGKLEWKPKERTSSRSQDLRTPGPRVPRTTPGPQDPRTPGPLKRKWVPKEEYKKSKGIEARRDKNWRPGGEHKDPRQKYKDAKKAKWGRFKQTIRKRWDAKPGKKRES